MAEAPKPIQDQGLFDISDVEYISNGASDPDSYKVVGSTANFTFPLETSGEENVSAETDQTLEQVSDFDEAAVVESLKQATANRSAAQAGKHSPLQRDGTYLTVRPGDVLPQGSGSLIVTKRNLEEARSLARGLEAKRRRRS